MALCYKPDDIAKSCDSSDLTALSGGLAINVKAFKPTKSAALNFTLADIDIIDPDTGAYPLITSDYYPIRVEWNKNAVQPNYEVVSSDVKRDTYTHIVPSVIINNSESDKGKETIVALTDEKYVFVYKASGTADADDAYQVLGAKNGMQFVVEPTSAELGGRVTGSFRSLTGGAEGNPNGLNFLMVGGIEATDTKFNNRFSTVVIP